MNENDNLDPSELYERLMKDDLHELVSSFKQAQECANKIYYLLVNVERDENLIALRGLIKFYRDACDHFADTIERRVMCETEDL